MILTVAKRVMKTEGIHLSLYSLFFFSSDSLMSPEVYKKSVSNAFRNELKSSICDRRRVPTAAKIKKTMKQITMNLARSQSIFWMILTKGPNVLVAFNESRNLAHWRTTNPVITQSTRSFLSVTYLINLSDLINSPPAFKNQSASFVPSSSLIYRV